MKSRHMLILTTAIALTAGPAGAAPKTPVKPVKLDAGSLEVVRRNIDLELSDDSLQALVSSLLAELAAPKEKDAPEQTIGMQAIFVSCDKRSYLFQPVSYELCFNEKQTLTLNCHGWFRDGWDWTILVDITAGKPEDWGRVTELFKGIRADAGSFRVSCTGTKLKTDDKLRYAFFTVDLSDSGQAATLCVPNVLAGLTF